MATSTPVQRIYDSTQWVESAGCILFDFRNTGFNPLTAPVPSTTTTTTTTTATPPSPSPISGLGSLPTSPHLTEEPKIVLFYSNPRNQYLLPKGRRNIGESRADAALRETFEETGLKCSLLPVTLHSRATSVNPADDRTTAGGYTVDEPRTFTRATEPFMCMVRRLDSRRGRDHTAADGSIARQVEEFVPKHVAELGGVGEVTKMIWWYVGVVDEDQGSEEEVEGRVVEPGCEVCSVGMREAMDRCSDRDDGVVVRRAVEVVSETFGL
ncbi:hypothetical protein LTS08_006326 [Lithohypha guttulata]|nr:hypothetical protein LTS08_006326 [Lithohypha guttulata]